MIINNFNINGGGGSSYELPVASDSTLGGVKVGEGLTIDSGGTLSVSGGSAGPTVVNLDALSQAELIELYNTLSGETTASTVNIDYVFLKDFSSAHSGNRVPYLVEFYGYVNSKVRFGTCYPSNGHSGEIWNLLAEIDDSGNLSGGMAGVNYNFPGLSRTQLISNRNYLKYDFTTDTFTTNNNNDILYTGDVRSFLWVIDPQENAFEGNKVPEYKFRLTDETYTDREFSNPVLSIVSLATPVSLPDSNGSYRDMDKIYYFDYGYCTVSMYVDSGGHSYARLKCVKNIPKWINISQADYDALVQAGTVDPNTYYVII